MHNPLFTVGALTTALLVAGCAAEDPGSIAGAPGRVYVGTATDAESDVKVLFGVVLDAGVLKFFACGDEVTGTTAAWVTKEGLDESAEEIVISTDSRWQLDAVVTADRVTGTLHDDPIGADEIDRTFDLTAELVDPGVAGGPGVYADDRNCQTGLVVPKEGAPQGSYCMPSVDAETANPRAQVTPIRPEGDGYLVRFQETDEPLRLERIIAAGSR
jgi:hypothetical protein